MKRLAIVLAVLSLLALNQVFQAADVQASSVPISESSYVKITNYYGQYLYMPFEPGGPPGTYEWKGVDTLYAQYYESIPTIEAKIINARYPYLPPATGWNEFEQNGLLFDFHSGNANIGEYASAMPVALCGMEPWTHIEFDWTSNISATAAPYLWLEVAGYSDLSFEQQVQWCMQLRVGTQSGNAVIDLPCGSIVDAVNLRLSVKPVPEPQSLIGLLVPTTVIGAQLIFRRRRK